MTERGRGARCSATPTSLTIGRARWPGTATALTIRIDEMTRPGPVAPPRHGARCIPDGGHRPVEFTLDGDGPASLVADRPAAPGSRSSWSSPAPALDRHRLPRHQRRRRAAGATASRPGTGAARHTCATAPAILYDVAPRAAASRWRWRCAATATGAVERSTPPPRAACRDALAACARGTRADAGQPATVRRDAGGRAVLRALRARHAAARASRSRRCTRACPRPLQRALGAG